MNLRPSILCLCLCCLLMIAAVAIPASHGETQPIYDFSLSNRFEYRRDASGYDSDFRSYGSAAAYNLMNGHLDARFSGATDIDLNNASAYDDAYNESWPRIHEALLDFHDYGDLSHLVIGRQYQSNVDNLHYDGLSLSLCEQDKVGFFAFGGRPVSYYTAPTDTPNPGSHGPSTTWHEDDGGWLGGGGVRYRPMASTQLQADAYGISDQGTDYLANALRMSQHFSSGFGDNVDARWVDGDFRDLSTRLFYQDAKRYDVAATVFWQAQRVGEDAEDRDSRYFSSYSGFMGPADENLYLSLDGNRYLGQYVTLNAGAGYKYLVDRAQRSDANFTNVDSQRFTTGITVADWPIHGLVMDFAGSYYLHPDENFYELTSEVGYDFTKKFHAGCGVTWGQYEYNDWLPFVDRFNNPVPAQDDRGGIQTTTTRFVEAQYKFNTKWRVAVRAEDEEVPEMSGDAYAIKLRVDYHFRTSPGQKPADKK